MGSQIPLPKLRIVYSTPMIRFRNILFCSTDTASILTCQRRIIIVQFLRFDLARNPRFTSGLELQWVSHCATVLHTAMVVEPFSPLNLPLSFHISSSSSFLMCNLTFQTYTVKFPFPSVTYSDYHYDDVLIVLYSRTLWLLKSDFMGSTRF